MSDKPERTFLESFQDRADAVTARDRYAETLKRLGETPRRQVAVERIRGRQTKSWAVYMYTGPEKGEDA